MVFCLNLTEIELTREVAFVSKIVFDYYNRWLRARRQGDELATAENYPMWKAWRGAIADKGLYLYQTLFLPNGRLMETWGQAKYAVLHAEERLVIRFAGPSSNLGLPFEALHDDQGPLSVRFPLSRRIREAATILPPWNRFLESLPERQLRLCSCPAMKRLWPKHLWSLANYARPWMQLEYHLLLNHRI